MGKAGDSNVAKDLVQDAFVQFYNQKSGLSTEVSVMAYLYVILKNRILNFHRSQLVRQKYENYIKVEHCQMQDNSLIDKIYTRELERKIEKEIDKLPDKCKIVFLMSRKEKLSNKEIAAKLNISENTIEQHIRKARRKLRISLGSHWQVLILFYFFYKH